MPDMTPLSRIAPLSPVSAEGDSPTPPERSEAKGTHAADPVAAARCRLREAMPVARTWTYLDHAAVAPLPGPTLAAITQWAADAAENGDVHWPEWARRVERVRARAADLLGASEAEIAFVANTTHGINCVAAGFPWVPGDNVVFVAEDFPSNVYPWIQLADRGVEARPVRLRDGRLELADLAAACDPRTRLVAVSWIHYVSGWRLNLDDVVDLAHARGALVMLDAIQGLGLFPLDLSQTAIDFLAADGHKWQLGPEGAGLLFVRADHRDLLRPWGVGWNSVPRPYDFHDIQSSFRPTAARWEGGSNNMPGLHGLGASLDLLADCGLSRGSSPLARAALDFAADAREELARLDAELLLVDPGGNNSSIVSFRWPGRDLRAIRQRCLDAGVVLSVRGEWLRISPHGYNDTHDLARFQSALHDALRL